MLASLINDVIMGKALTIKAPHAVIRSYTHIFDMLSLALRLLINQQSIICDIASDEAIEIGDLARRITQALGRENTPINRPSRNDKTDRYLGDPRLFYQMMENHKMKPMDLDQQIMSTYRYLHDQNSQQNT